MDKGLKRFTRKIVFITGAGGIPRHRPSDQARGGLLALGLVKHGHRSARVVQKGIVPCPDYEHAKAQALDTWALFSSVDGLWEESAYLVAKSYQREGDMAKARTWFEKLQGSSIERWRVVARGALAQLVEQ